MPPALYKDQHADARQEGQQADEHPVDLQDLAVVALAFAGTGKGGFNHGYVCEALGLELMVSGGGTVSGSDEMP